MMQESYGMDRDAGQHPDERPLKVYTVRRQSIAYLVIARSHQDAKNAIDRDSHLDGFLLGRSADAPEIDATALAWLCGQMGTPTEESIERVERGDFR